MTELFDEFEHIWAKIVAPGGSLDFSYRFPRFPNPHLRSNAFMLKREVLIESTPHLDKTKIACCEFESGENSLSRTLLRRGKRLLVVDADGRGFDVADWADSNTFRSEGRQNLLVSDNRTSDFTAFSSDEQAVFRKQTWGDATAKGVLGITLDPSPVQANVQSLAAPAINHQLRLFSVVIPTHNRAELLAEAVKTVSRQQFSNWELVLFDNGSDPANAEAIAALAGNRIRYARSDEFLHVTDSWNRAIDMASGDYVTFLGDDDGLAPNYFERLTQIADRFGEPDLIFGALYQFMHPGVMPDDRAGRTMVVKYASFFEDRGHPFLLSEDKARQAVCGSLELRRSMTYNIQGFVFKRDFVDRLRTGGKFFLSSFPDYYIANVALALADKIVVDPQPLAIQGVSRASFGFTLFNKREDEGYKLLNHELERDPRYQQHRGRMLPGPLYNGNVILTMDWVADKLGPPYPRPDFDRYRRLQIFSHLQATQPGHRPFANGGAALWSQLTAGEKTWALGLWALQLTARHAEPRQLRTRATVRLQKVAKQVGQYAFTPATVVLNSGDYLSVDEIFTDLDRGALP